MRGYHRGVAVAQALWEKKQQALYDLNATETELRGLRNRNIG
jgi:hypothetical protein